MDEIINKFKTVIFIILLFILTPIFASGQESHRFKHPTLPIEIQITILPEDQWFNKVTREEINYNIKIFNTDKNVLIYEDRGFIPRLFMGDFKNNFFYDLNFDGHKEYILYINNPQHYDDAVVYLLNSSHVVKEHLTFSEIKIDTKNKQFTVTEYHGSSGYVKRTYEYKDNKLNIIKKESY